MRLDNEYHARIGRVIKIPLSKTFLQKLTHFQKLWKTANDLFFQCMTFKLLTIDIKTFLFQVLYGYLQQYQETIVFHTKYINSIYWNIVVIKIPHLKERNHNLKTLTHFPIIYSSSLFLFICLDMYI